MPRHFRQPDFLPANDLDSDKSARVYLVSFDSRETKCVSGSAVRSNGRSLCTNYSALCVCEGDRKSNQQRVHVDHHLGWREGGGEGTASSSQTKGGVEAIHRLVSVECIIQGVSDYQ